MLSASGAFEPAVFQQTPPPGTSPAGGKERGGRTIGRPAPPYFLSA